MGMDSHCTTLREDVFCVQMDLKRIQNVQLNHSDRLLKLEKRQADDAALKSVWGSASPFPSVLSCTLQQDPTVNSREDFLDKFDDEQEQNIIGNLQLETDEEPVRRGASRQNSVRFDSTTFQASSWGLANRNSGESIPVHLSNDFESHPMMERSFSHKSDGRHSSTGHSIYSLHSVPSGRTSSLGLDTNFVIGDSQDNDSSLETTFKIAPGGFFLGSVPSIIRCWLTTNFSNNSLLYAVICTGSQRTVLDYNLVEELGLRDLIQKDNTGRCIIKLTLYLPEAIITHIFSRSTFHMPQLPSISVNFEVIEMNQQLSRTKGICIFLGSDILRSYSADILFSQNLMTIYGDDKNKLSIPFVRPEDDEMFKNLCTSNFTREKNGLKATAPPFTPTDSRSKSELTPNIPNKFEESNIILKEQRSTSPSERLLSTMEKFSNDCRRTSSTNSVKTALAKSELDTEYSRIDSPTNSPQVSNIITTESTCHEPPNVIWGSWRTENFESGSRSGYQRAKRGGRNMKILKPPSKPISTSNNMSPVNTDSPSEKGFGQKFQPSTPKPSEFRKKSKFFSKEQEDRMIRKESRKTISEECTLNKSNSASGSSNPVGGGSAFAWMNSRKAITATPAAGLSQ